MCVCVCVLCVCICAYAYVCMVCVWCLQMSRGVDVEVEEEVCVKLCTWCLCVQGVLINIQYELFQHHFFNPINILNAVLQLAHLLCLPQVLQKVWQLTHS